MKVRITNGMYTALIINLVYAKAIGVTQGMIAREVGHDMWISTLLAILQGAVMIYIGFLVTKRTEAGDFPAVAASLLGRWFGLFVAMLLIVFFVCAFGAVMITYVYHLRDYFLPTYPLALFLVAALVIGSAGAYYGIEVMGRMAYAGLFFIFLLNILLLTGSIEEFDIRNLQPVLENGLPNVLMASRHHDADWAMATMMTAMLIPKINRGQDRDVRGRAGVIGILIGGMMVLQWPILEAGVLSGEVTSQYIVSCMKLARSAHIGQFLHRYEMLMIAFFAISCLVQVMTCTYCTSELAGRVFGVKNHRKLIVPVCALLGVFGYWVVQDHMRALRLLNLWPWIGLPIAIGLPVLLLLISMLKPNKRTPDHLSHR